MWIGVVDNKPCPAVQRQMSKISSCQHEHFVLCVLGILYEQHSSCISSAFPQHP